MPLTKEVFFKAILQKGGRIQIPRLYRWQHKMEPDQVLNVKVRLPDSYSEEFLARMTKDGRLTIPKLTLKLLQNEQDQEESLAGHVLEITVRPLQEPKH